MATQGTFPLSTFNSSESGVRAFCWRLGIFVVPLIGALVSFELMLWRTGESWPVSRVVRTQLRLGQTPSLYERMLLSQQFNLYKYEMIKAKRPKIIIHGTSRVMQIRDFVVQPLHPWFYNAGGMIRGPDDVATYVRMIREGELPRPEVVIMGIEPWWVKHGDAGRGWLDRDSLRDVAMHFPAHIEAARLFVRRRVFPWKAVLAGAPSPSPGYGYQAIGAQPLLNGDGFRIDGSLQLGVDVIRESLRDPRYKDRNNILQMVTDYLTPFDLPASIDESRVKTLLAALTELQQMAVEVHVFLPPFASEVQAVFETSSTWNPFWQAFHLDLPRQIRAAGISCLPLSVPAQDGFGDSYMYDGYHPTEIYAAAIVKQIVQKSSPHSLLHKIDLVSLDALISRRYATPLSFEEPPGQ
jgi:hypothetical protein